MKSTTLITIVIVALTVAAGGFFAGTKYQASKQPRFGQFGDRVGQNNRVQPNGQRSQFRGGSLISGQVMSLDSQSLTVKETDGSSKIVILSGTTNYVQNSPATVQNIKVGDKVTVVGQPNADGSVSARTISLGEGLFGQGSTNPPAPNQ